MDWEQKSLVNELTQGKELTEKLRNNLINSISSPEMRQILVDQILSSYEKALNLLNFDVSAIETKPVIHTLESPHSCANSSPRSEVSDQDCKNQFSKSVYKKRKTQARWTEQVKVCSGTAMEGPLDDGYSWRKYGQKDILGANFPRGYYRCTHRHSQGCLATKQVQRSDEDATIFEVTYRGRHTCFQSSRLANDNSNQNKDNFQHQEKPKPKPLLKELSFKDGFKTEDLESLRDIFPSFSFSDIGTENEGNYDIFKIESSLFESPATSESNYLSSVSACHYNERTPETESVPTSVTNSPIQDWDISIEDADFDISFLLENPESFAFK
ncbi:probable WRKY transcription factor 53 [Mercurialis annua]|uniref:probable WRKY transcription factor 53 n=1 Tax=Mercurialis annua TaxID=3986 RepID=UPI00215F11E7|nr:probable WRKY transcription factor 53 [Mercurialis annua]